MSKRIERQLTGKIGEFRVFAKLMEQGLVPYVPLVDEGIDCLLRNGIKIQIKTVKTQRDPRWFQVTNLSYNPQHFFECYTLMITVLVLAEFHTCILRGVKNQPSFLSRATYSISSRQF